MPPRFTAFGAVGACSSMLSLLSIELSLFFCLLTALALATPSSPLPIEYSMNNAELEFVGFQVQPRTTFRESSLRRASRTEAT